MVAFCKLTVHCTPQQSIHSNKRSRACGPSAAGHLQHGQINLAPTGSSGSSAAWTGQCHAVSEQSSMQSPLPAGQKLEHPLVERLYDHNWRTPLAGHDHPDPRCRPVLALGKFDALHKGHQALAAAALELGGTPVLLSFSGMAAVLGWAPRKPLVAPCDRPRVLNLWALQLAQQQMEQQQRQQQRRHKRLRPEAAADLAGPAAAPAAAPAASAAASISASQAGPEAPAAVQRAPRKASGVPSAGAAAAAAAEAGAVVPVRQRYIPFEAIRSLSPETFVSHIVQDFRAAGVVSGSNYRFGYKAAGDAALLKHLSAAADLPAAVVEMVGAATPGAVGPVSSTKIREMLDSCRMEAVKRSLGRPYRLVAEVDLQDWQQQQLRGFSSSVSISTSSSNGNSSSGGTTRIMHPGWVFVPHSSLLNQQPAPGVFLCSLQLYVGATAHDDLLQLQQAVVGGSSSSSGSGIQILPVVGGSSSNRSSGWCIHAEQQQVEVVPDGLLVPRAIWDAADSCLNNSAGSMMLSQSSSGSSSGTPGLDPLCWDTDDRESSVDEEPAAASRPSGSLHALLVLDVDSCVMQMCAL